MFAAIRTAAAWLWRTIILGVPAPRRLLYVPDPLYADYLARRELARCGRRTDHLAPVDYPEVAPLPQTLDAPQPEPEHVEV